MHAATVSEVSCSPLPRGAPPGATESDGSIPGDVTCVIPNPWPRSKPSRRSAASAALTSIELRIAKLSATRHGTSVRWRGDGRERGRGVCERNLIVNRVVALSRGIALQRGAPNEGACEETFTSTGRTCRLAYPLMRLRINASTTRARMHRRREMGRREHDLVLIADADRAARVRPPHWTCRVLSQEAGPQYRRGPRGIRRFPDRRKPQCGLQHAGRFFVAGLDCPGDPRRAAKPWNAVRRGEFWCAKMTKCRKPTL